MKFDNDKLEKDIDALEGICDDGKKGIKALFKNHFGVEFSKPQKVYNWEDFAGKRFRISGFSEYNCIFFRLNDIDYYLLSSHNGKNRWREPETVKEFSQNVQNGTYIEVN